MQREKLPPCERVLVLRSNRECLASFLHIDELLLTVPGNLIIHNVRMSDQGTYICQTGNGGRITHTAIANVEVLGE